MEPTDRRTFLAASAALTASGMAASVVGTASAAAPAAGAAAPAAAAASPAAAVTAGVLAVEGLTVNEVTGAIGVDPDDLSFAWTLRDHRPGARQTAYRVTVATARGRRVWDSANVASDRQAFVAYAGPTLHADTRYRCQVRVADGAGYWGPATTATFSTGLRDGDWTAHWLHPGPPRPPGEAYTYLRTVVRPAGSPVVRATAYVAAAHKYQLFVGGALADTGPSFCYPDEQYVQATDVTGLVRAGAPMVIGVLHKWYGPGQGRPASAPGLLAQVNVHHADGRVERFGTDGRWRQHAAEWLPGVPRNTEGDFTENIDGRLTPLGWPEPAFDDRSWTPATVIGPIGSAPFTALVAQRTRIAEHPVRPVSVRTFADGSVVADFGEIYAARPEVTFSHGVAGRPVAMHVGYLLDPDGRVSTVHGTQGTDLSFGYIQRDGRQTFLPFTFLGFRYLEIDDPGEPLDAADITALARHAAMPAAAVPATFASSNPMLDRVFALCTRSALYASHEQFVDTPTREKGQFLWDAANESEAVMHAFGDHNLTWQALRDFHRSQERYWPNGLINTVYPNGDGARSIPEFAERYPEWLWRYHLATGDLATVEAHYPAVRNLVAYVTESIDPGTGLVTDLQGGGSDAGASFIDGPPAMLYGYDTSVAAITTTNALSVNLFTRAAQLAALVGDVAGQQALAARAGALTAAVNARLVGPSGVYIDGLDADGAQSPHASQQANALALAYGLVPPARLAAVGRYVTSLGIRSGPPRGMELARAVHAAGLDADLVHLLTDPNGPGYAHIVSVGGTFTWESWTPADIEGDSLSHGWGSSLLVAMQEALLGVTPATATTFDITPPGDALAGLTEVRGSLPTLAGPLTVRWQRGGGGLTLDVTLPPNASGRVHLPGRIVTIGSGSSHLADASA